MLPRQLQGRWQALPEYIFGRPNISVQLLDEVLR